MGGEKVSVAEARQNFARLIKRAQRGDAIEITRRGESVAVILSASEYLALSGERPSFIQAAREVREKMDVENLDIEGEIFEGLRDDSSGREVSF
jgi:prevent-host-death family protein